MSDFKVVMQAITEEAKTKISASVRLAYRSVKTRAAVAKKYKDAFLDMKRLKFPVKDPNGKYDCALIYAAYMRALMNEQRSTHGRLKTNLGGGYYQTKRKKAKELFSGCGCEKELHVKLHTEDMGGLDFISFADLLEIDESMLPDSGYEFDDDYVDTQVD